MRPLPATASSGNIKGGIYRACKKRFQTLYVISYVIKAFYVVGIMVEIECRRRQVQGFDTCHLAVGKPETENIEVFGHTLFVSGFGYAHHSPLREPAQCYLRYRFVVRLAYFTQNVVLKEAVAPFDKSALRLMPDSLFLHKTLVFATLPKYMRFYLIDHRHNLVVINQIDKAVGRKVADADSPNHPLVVELLQSPPGAVVVAKRLVDEVKVEILQSQTVEGAVESPLCTVVACILHPEFGGNEQFLKGHTATADGGPHGLLVLIGGSRVYEAIARFDGVRYTLCTILGGNLIYSKAQ